MLVLKAPGLERRRGKVELQWKERTPRRQTGAKWWAAVQCGLTGAGRALQVWDLRLGSKGRAGRPGGAARAWTSL